MLAGTLIYKWKKHIWRTHHNLCIKINTVTIKSGTTDVTSKTKPYIRETKDNYLALVNDIVHRAITDTLDNYSIKYLKVIASYLQLYPFIMPKQSS